jgi:glycosyltransferase involved in cell wall biosynthesis
MRVVFVYGFCGLGGVETSILNKLTALETVGVEGHAVFSEFYGSGGGTLAHHPRVSVGLDGRDTSRLLESCDAICLVDYPAFLDAIPDQLEAPLVWESHDSSDATFGARYVQALNHPRVAAIVVPSQFNRRRLQRITTKVVEVIPNPIDDRVFFCRPPRAVPRPWPGPMGGPVLLWVGRLEDEKNPLEFARIGERVLGERPDARCLAVGDAASDTEYTDYRDRFLGSISEDRRRHFRFVRSVPYRDMPGLYSLAARSGGCLVSTSRYESSPMTFIEAMACLCPVVSTDVGGVGELISDHVTGRLYAAGDLDGGVQAILETIEPSRGWARQELTRSARAAVEERHAMAAVARKYRGLLERVVGS